MGMAITPTLSLSMYINHAHRSATLHESSCHHSANRKAEDSENGLWYDGLQSEVAANKFLDRFSQVSKTKRYQFRRCQSCAPVR